MVSNVILGLWRAYGVSLKCHFTAPCVNISFKGTSEMPWSRVSVRKVQAHWPSATMEWCQNLAEKLQPNKSNNNLAVNNMIKSTCTAVTPFLLSFQLFRYHSLGTGINITDNAIAWLFLLKHPQWQRFPIEFCIRVWEPTQPEGENQTAFKIPLYQLNHAWMIRLLMVVRNPTTRCRVGDRAVGSDDEQQRANWDGSISIQLCAWTGQAAWYWLIGMLRRCRQPSTRLCQGINVIQQDMWFELSCILLAWKFAVLGSFNLHWSDLMITESDLQSSCKTKTCNSV